GGIEVGDAEKQSGGEGLPRGRVDRTSRELLDAVPCKRTEGLVGHRPAADADDADARRQQAVDVQVVERWQQLPVREIAGAAENDDRHFAFLTAWPPN